MAWGGGAACGGSCSEGVLDHGCGCGCGDG